MKTNVNDLSNKYVGKKYNLLSIIKLELHKTVLANDGFTRNYYNAICKCDCGKAKSIALKEVINNGTKSCGCLLNKHGKKNSTEYRIWVGIKNRCYNQKHEAYHNYGGRGIIMSDVWRSSFKTFYSDIGKRPSMSVTLDRINNNGNYENGNVKWSNKKEQGRNTRINRLITFNNKTMCLIEWAENIGVTSDTLARRLDKYKWSLDKALTTPTRTKKISCLQLSDYI